MRRIISTVLTLSLVLAFGAPALAGDEAQEVRLAGWITDSFCGKANANAKGKDCIEACAKNGAKLVLSVDDKIYQLSDQDGAKQHVGHEVVVTGVVTDDKIEVKKFEKKNA
jgi:hypothetical protein